MGPGWKPGRQAFLRRLSYLLVAHPHWPVCFSPPVTTSEQELERLQEPQGLATEEKEKKSEKVDKDLPTDAEPKPVDQGEVEAPTVTTAVSNK